MSESGEERPPSSASDDSIQRVIDTTPALLHTGLPDGSLDYFNERWLVFLGVPLEEVRGWRWTRFIHAEDREAFVAKWRHAIATGEPFEAESRVWRADGRYRWLLHRKVPLRDASGTIVKWYGSSTDIEDRKQAEERARCQERELREIVDLVPHHIVVVAPDGTGIYGNQVMLDYYGLKLEDITGPVIQRFAHPDDIDAFTAAWRRGFAAGGAWETEARFRRRDGEYRWFLTRVNPLRDDAGRIVRWYATGTDIDERKRGEDALRASEERFRTLVDHATDSFGLVDERGIVVDVNREACESRGYRREEMIGMTVSEIDPDVDLDAIQKRFEAGEQVVTFESRNRRKDGTVFPVEVRTRRFLSPEGRMFSLTLGRDITERKRADQALRESEERYRALIEVAPQIVWMARADGSNIFWNQWWYDYTGLTQTESEEFGWVRAVHPEHRDRHVHLWLQALASGVEWHNEAPLRRADGQYRWHLGRGLPIRDADGRIVRWMGIGLDIHDRREAEEALRRSGAWLSEAQRLSRTGSWAMNPQTREVVYASKEFLRITGFEEGDGIPSAEAVLGRLHPDDRPGAIEDRLHNETDYAGERRLVLPDGTIRHIQYVVHPAFDSAGHCVELIGTVADVTERKRAEERVRQDERELRTIVDFLPELLVVGDAHGGLAYANRAALEFTGRTLEETVARPDVWSEIVHPDDLDTVQTTIRALAEGIRGEVEFRLRRADGQYRWILGRSAPLRDAEDRVIGWFSTGTDIDDRKRAEQRMQDENLALREEVDRASMFEEIVGGSPALRAVLTSVAQVAPTDSTVLITGETGTGKELLARAIHKRSPRAARAFVGVNCAAIPPTLIASELFGHEKGAFTGALQRRAGRFELADGGTIFLDEVGDLPSDTQLALLRVIQERELERVGSTRPIKVDVRIIAATNRDLKAAIEADAFRTDLFYRLNVFPIEMPPLRERLSDIPLLVAYFVDRYASQAGKTIRRVDKRTLDLVKSYGWPGNVRELQNVIERAVIICDSGTLTVDPRWLSQETAKPVRPLGDELTTRERQMIETALAESRGRVAGATGAAAKLGLHPSTLDSKIRALRIDKHRFKRP